VLFDKMKVWFIKYFDYYFLALAIIELVFTQYYPQGRVITKPLLLISLMAYYVLSNSHVDKLFVLALFFAFLGDTFLLSNDYFLFGLGSFLVMQLLYAYCFFKQGGQLTVYKTLGCAAIAFSTGAILYLLIPDLSEELKIPVVVYSISIGLMAIAAIARKHTGSDYWFIFFGVISFLISDSVLGLNKFGSGFELAGLLVMFTYILAQYLIVKGYLRYRLGNNASLQT